MIQAVIDSIGVAEFIPTFQIEGTTIDMQEFLETIEKQHKLAMEELVKKYKTIPPLLGKIEGIIEQTNTLRSAKMRSYYLYWEKKVFAALNKLVTNNLSKLQGMMNISSKTEGKKQALFQVVASLSAPEIVLTPNYSDVNKIISRILKVVVEGTQSFVRWMDGTCIETAPQFINNDNEPIIFSFYTDVSANPQVIKMLLLFNQGIAKTFRKVDQYLDGWKRYKPLWKIDRGPTLEKFVQKNPSVIDFDSKLTFYKKLGSEVESLPTEKDIDFLRISCVPLEAAIKSETTSWLLAIGELLHRSVKQKLFDIYDEFAKIQNDLNRKTDELDDLKFILGVMEKVRTSGMSMELRYSDIEERYRTLQMYNIPIPFVETEMVQKLRERWNELIKMTEDKDLTLVSVKTHFTETTKDQVTAFQKKASKLAKNFKKSGPGAEGIEMDYGLELVKKYQKEYSKFAKQRDELVLAEKLFNLPITAYPELVEIENELEGLNKVYALYSDQKEAISKWANTLWTDLDIEALSKGIDEFVQRLKKLPNELKQSRPYSIVNDLVNSFRDSIPLFRHLKSDALRARHWKQLMDVTGQSFQTNSKNFTLDSVFKMELHKYAEKIEEIVSAAAKELSIEQGIQKIADTWKNIRFEVTKYVKGAEDRGFVLKGVDEVLLLYDDNTMSLQGMNASRYVAAFAKDVQKWEKTLSLISEVTEVWMLVQRKWIYLENIFLGSQDIRLQLPEEAKKFERVDKTFKKIMTETSKNTLVLEACTTERLDLLKSLAQQLETCQKSLSEYLLKKRNAFPRFFFISDDELLSIIGSQDPASVQEHMIKLFENVLSLQFGSSAVSKNTKTVLALTSAEGEVLPLKQSIVVEGQVESWMLTIDNEMKRTLRQIAKEALFQYSKQDRMQWVYSQPGMITLSGSQIWWTWEVEDTFRQVRDGDKQAMKTFSGRLLQRLNQLVAEVRKDLSDLDRNKINTLIIIDVHARDVIEKFVRDSILDEREFEWESQLRYYWDKGIDDIVVRQASAVFNYGHEYLGLSGRLVVTPLTERCYLTLSQALSFKLGGSPAGPAGTGKTETVKDLAKGIGLHCVVFNCSEAIDYATMGAIFSGLVQSGGWGCFDEFNRIDAEVLSVISVQIKTIQNAMKNSTPRFVFEGNEIPLDLKAGVFITMNPHYAGRTELPDNLKALFRPVVMVVPDLELICEIMLFSEGFTTAKVLAKKMNALYTLCKEQLSRQHHYDFGLRALKSVLVRAGSAKRESPDVPEQDVVVGALRDLNLPRFVYSDVPLFVGLLGDLFPGQTINPSRNEQMRNAVETALKEQQYEVLQDQVDRIIQLYETFKTRHTCMVVGPTGGGKSVVVDIFARALTLNGYPTKLYVLNPKAQTVNELYGLLDPNTRDWTDGLLSSIFRETNKPLPPDKKDRKFIIFDGDVDTIWVENMNSVMDDNKLLTLPNGERIRLQKHCALLFEVADLKHASHATVSRCGMVYMDPQNLGYTPYIYKWLAGRTKSEVDSLKPLFQKYVPPCIDYIFDGIINDQVTQKLKTVVPVTKLAVVKQLCTMLDILISKDDTLEARAIECIFIFSVIWSLGAPLIEESRNYFDSFVKRLSDWTLIENPDIPVGPGQLPSALPTLYEYKFDKSDLLWKSWVSEISGNFAPTSDMKFYQMLVPTVDTVRNTWLLDAFVKAKVPVLFVGDSGTAKTAVIDDYMRKLDPEKYAKLSINFSSTTTSADLQRNLESNLERWSKGTYGPSPGKQLLVFVDDLNMPLPDKYETQQPIALLKLLFEKGGFYDRGKELNWKSVRNFQFVAAMAPPGGGRNVVDPRFISLFNILNVAFPAESTIHRIYSQLLESHLDPFPDNIKEVGSKLTDLTIKLYQFVVQRLPPTPARFHYIFNLRDISRIYEGLRLTTIDKFDTPDSLARVWRHECVRVFCDRLITEEDKKLVMDKIEEMVHQNFPNEASNILSDPTIFGDYKSPEEEAKLYEDYYNYTSMRPYFEDMLTNYNERNSPMNLVLFDDAIEHLARMLRVIRRPRGHMLLIGITGCGKQSLARLAAFVARCSLFEIALSKGYGETEFKEDMKKLYHMAGIEGKETVFLFTESHLAKESFMEYINNMLTAGIIPALFTDDEKAGIIGNIRDEVVKAGIVDTSENCWLYFLNKCRDNLHLIVCMAPGDQLRKRCRNFPGLVSNCVIDWFFKWPEQALQAVASSFISNPNANAQAIDVPAELRDDIVGHLVFAHGVVEKYNEKLEELGKHNYVTPKHFLDYIGKFSDLLKENRKKITDAIKRFEGGLQKLIDAAAYLDQLNAKLVVQKAQVDQKAEANNALLLQITENKAKVQAKQRLATAKERELKELQTQIISKKEEAEQGLAEALPAVEAARAALSNLSKQDITELRSFATPAKAVQIVAQCVCILLGLKDDISWKSAKGMMAGISFISDLLSLNPDELTDKQMKAVKDLLKKMDVTAEKMESISAAAFGLYNWVLAIVKFSVIAKGVIPKKKAVEAAQKGLAQNEKDLETIKQEIESLSAELIKLEEQLAKGTAEQTELREQAEIMEKRLTAASKLISGLGTERVRWGKEIEELNEKKKRVAGDGILAAAFLSYAGPFTFELRQDLLRIWQSDVINRSIPFTQPFKLEEILTDDVEISRWVNEGLPPDELSIQNGILVTRASRWPLCIDPQMQAVNWIMKKEAKQKLTVRTFHDSDFAKQLELSISYGVPLLVAAVDHAIDPLLDPVLVKNIKVSGSRRFIQLGDKDVDWNDSFKLFLTTKRSNPNYAASVYGNTMAINFNLTYQGLVDQLLSVVVGYEQPELEQRREALVSEMSENRSLIKKFEDILLRELANSTGNMLDNTELIATLESTKEKAVEIEQKMIIAKETAKEIERLRDGYRPAAKRGAILFFVMSKLSSVNSMYQYALSSFLEVFKKSLSVAPHDAVLTKRIKNIVDTVTAQTYNYVGIGLFEKHKLLFAFQMCIDIMQGENLIDNRLLDFVLKGNTSLDKSPQPSPFPWLTEKGWQDLNKLASMGPEFQDLIAQLKVNSEKWKSWYDLEAPEQVHPPMEVELNDMQQVAVLRCFRPDRVYMSISKFVASNLGEKYTQNPVATFQNIYDLSTPFSPIIFILSPGAEPANDVRQLADALGFGGTRLKEHPLGQNQGPVAAVLLENGATRGQWVMLQNCHLLTSWLKTLEKLLDRLQEKPSKDFRCWLTTEPTPDFPIGILQRALKVVTEPPNGLKLNMTSSFSKITDDALAQCPHPAFKSLVFSLTFLHAVVQERRKYGYIGWNIPYDFNESDFHTSMMLLNTYLTKSAKNKDKTIPWPSLRYLIGEVIYGGRVTDNFDRRVMKTYLDEYMGDFLFDTFHAFHFYKDDKVNYTIPSIANPNENVLQMYRAAIDKMPHTNSPEVFGLHANAELGYYTESSNEMARNLVGMQISSGDSGSSSGFNPMAYIGSIAKDIASRVPAPFDLAVITKELLENNKGKNNMSRSGSMQHQPSQEKVSLSEPVLSPTQVVLLQELERWNALVSKMKSSLSQLQQALVGEVGMSNELEDLATALHTSTVPNTWRLLSPATKMNLPAWMNNFQNRYKQYSSWINSKSDPLVMWLPGLHVPESYLKALMQTACRKKGWHLDKATLFTHVTNYKSASEVTQRPEIGCFISGLFLEGASWDHQNMCLKRQEPKKLVEEFPIIQIIPIEKDRLKLQNTFRTPVYVTPERATKTGVGIVFEVDLPTHEHPSHWVLQGVCLTLQSD